MKVNRESFVSVIRHLKPAIYNKDFVPILGCYCFDGDEKSVFAYNDIIAIKTDKDFGIDGAVKGNVLHSLAQTFVGDEVEIKQTSDSVIIKNSTAKLKLPLVGKNEFVFKFPEIPNDLVLVFDEKHLDAIRFCLRTAGTDTSFPEMMGITIKIETDKVVFYSTNGRGISKAIVSGNVSQNDIELNRILILPIDFCKTIVDFAEDYPEMALKFFLTGNEEDRYVIAEFGDYTLFSKLVAGVDPIDFEEKIAETMQGVTDENFSSISEELISALNRVFALTSLSRDGKCNVVVKDGVLHIKGICEHGHIDDVIELNGNAIEQDVLIDIFTVPSLLSDFSDFVIVERAFVAKNDDRIVLVSNRRKGKE